MDRYFLVGLRDLREPVALDVAVLGGVLLVDVALDVAVLGGVLLVDAALDVAVLGGVFLVDLFDKSPVADSECF